MAPLALFNEGYQRTLPLCHAFVIDMVIAMGHGIPASSESRFIHSVNKASSERDGDGANRPAANKRKPIYSRSE